MQTPQLSTVRSCTIKGLDARVERISGYRWKRLITNDPSSAYTGLSVAEETLDVGKKPGRPPSKAMKAEEDEMAFETEGPSTLAGGFDATFGVVAVETATGDVMYGHFKDTVMRSDLESCMISAAPVELLLADPISAPTEKVSISSSSWHRYSCLRETCNLEGPQECRLRELGLCDRQFRSIGRSKTM